MATVSSEDVSTSEDISSSPPRKKASNKRTKQEKIHYDAYFGAIGGADNVFKALPVDPLPTGEKAMSRFLAEGRRLFYTMKTFDRWCLRSLLLDPKDDEYDDISFEIPEADKKFLADSLIEVFKVREKLMGDTVPAVRARRKSLLSEISNILGRMKKIFVCDQAHIPPTKLARFVWKHLSTFETQEKALFSFGKVLNTLEFLHERYDWPSEISERVQNRVLDDEDVETPCHNLWLTDKMEMFASTIDEKGASIVKRWKHLDNLYREKLTEDELIAYKFNYDIWDGRNCMPACGYWEPLPNQPNLRDIHSSQSTLKGIGSLEEYPPNITDPIPEESEADDEVFMV